MNNMGRTGKITGTGEPVTDADCTFGMTGIESGKICVITRDESTPAEENEEPAETESGAETEPELHPQSLIPRAA